MISTLIMATLAMAQAPKTVCPVMGDAVPANAKRYVYKDVVFGVCCPGCIGSVKKDADKVFAQATGLVGYSLFDVVSKEAVAPQDAVASTDFKNVRYFFLKAENKAAFDKDPAEAIGKPNYEASGKCVVTGESFKHEEAAAYRDIDLMADDKVQSVRVYFCCPGCMPKFDADSKKYAANLKPTKSVLHAIVKD
ncbi:MAG: hypothetical protein ACR2HJ_09905 [Fimbriimonadales bacterium]